MNFGLNQLSTLNNTSNVNFGKNYNRIRPKAPRIAREFQPMQQKKKNGFVFNAKSLLIGIKSFLTNLGDKVGV